MIGLDIPLPSKLCFIAPSNGHAYPLREQTHIHLVCLIVITLLLSAMCDSKNRNSAVGKRQLD